jgi:hypothetical protein
LSSPKWVEKAAQLGIIKLPLTLPLFPRVRGMPAYQQAGDEGNGLGWFFVGLCAMMRVYEEIGYRIYIV